MLGASLKRGFPNFSIPNSIYLESRLKTLRAGDCDRGDLASDAGSGELVKSGRCSGFCFWEMAVVMVLQGADWTVRSGCSWRSHWQSLPRWTRKLTWTDEDPNEESEELLSQNVLKCHHHHFRRHHYHHGNGPGSKIEPLSIAPVSLVWFIQIF